ncbi:MULTISPECIES: glycosyltransferase family 4 protein [Providencia]|uniref:glycosyltransferase family 4 protein n=1 Tax=Providencia TaxID=586 RepID=UPI00197DAE19|nr:MULTISPECIES: glycosyltransferase family 4 protein [Providencia]MBN4866507.1 glycosyltransferase family 4 protein [Providencia stuartii]MBN4875829.1 glycosyltransferase family 4 protein [Providencia stuartii]MBN4880521.1 glycosyltransferase family 4 protein [Providencia stuartii]MBN4885029.1 glycosyltransferase family 4 protein [Providencia stuartii]
MKIIHLSNSDISGGAARAAYRLHKALQESGIDSQMFVRTKKSDDWTVLSTLSNTKKLFNLLRPTLGKKLSKLQHSDNINLRSVNWLPSSWSKEINSSDIDIVNIHWVGSETLSIEDIGQIKKPIVWTMHDMWPFCGAEHYTNDDQKARWLTGYKKNNRLPHESKIDIDRLTWERKKKAWKNTNMHIISPSQWLADCAKQSVLFQNNHISTIPNPLDTNVYQPIDKNFCKRMLKLPIDKNIILFGAIGGGNDPRKGYDLLKKALFQLRNLIDPNSVECVIFGQSEPKSPIELPFNTHWLGHINDDITLALIYNTATLMVVPSRAENLPQTATEAQSCGIPVVCFATTGLLDTVDHEKTGYLVKPFDTMELASSMAQILNDSQKQLYLSKGAREKALSSWRKDIIIEHYNDIYQSILSKNSSIK